MSVILGAILIYFAVRFLYGAALVCLGLLILALAYVYRFFFIK